MLDICLCPASDLADPDLPTWLPWCYRLLWRLLDSRLDLVTLTGPALLSFPGCFGTKLTPGGCCRLRLLASLLLWGSPTPAASPQLLAELQTLQETLASLQRQVLTLQVPLTPLQPWRSLSLNLNGEWARLWGLPVRCD